MRFISVSYIIFISNHNFQREIPKPTFSSNIMTSLSLTLTNVVCHMTMLIKLIKFECINVYTVILYTQQLLDVSYLQTSTARNHRIIQSFLTRVLLILEILAVDVCTWWYRQMIAWNSLIFRNIRGSVPMKAAVQFTSRYMVPHYSAKRLRYRYLIKLNSC